MVEQCKGCDKEFKNAQALEHHKASKHPAAAPRIAVKKNHVIAVIVALVVIGGGILAYRGISSIGNHDVLAKCLTEKGATFYGAFWCPHCKRQKEMFGNSMQYIKYVECSTPDGKGQTDECKSMNIDGYPTWVFADGSRVSGEQSLASLGTKADCPSG